MPGLAPQLPKWAAATVLVCYLFFLGLPSYICQPRPPPTESPTTENPRQRNRQARKRIERNHPSDGALARAAGHDGADRGKRLHDVQKRYQENHTRLPISSTPALNTRQFELDTSQFSGYGMAPVPKYSPPFFTPSHAFGLCVLETRRRKAASCAPFARLARKAFLPQPAIQPAQSVRAVSESASRR